MQIKAFGYTLEFTPTVAIVAFLTGVALIWAGARVSGRYQPLMDNQRMFSRKYFLYGTGFMVGMVVLFAGFTNILMVVLWVVQQLLQTGLGGLVSWLLDVIVEVFRVSTLLSLAGGLLGTLLVWMAYRVLCGTVALLRIGHPHFTHSWWMDLAAFSASVLFLVTGLAATIWIIIDNPYVLAWFCVLILGKQLNW